MLGWDMGWDNYLFMFGGKNWRMESLVLTHPHFALLNNLNLSSESKFDKREIKNHKKSNLEMVDNQKSMIIYRET